MGDAGALSAEQLAELRSELEGEMARLERSLRSTRDAARPVQLDQTAVGRLSRIDEIQNQQLSAELHERNEARHTELVEALERMRTGSYGVCARCGGGIPYGRLLALPEARACAGCGGRAG